VIWIDAVCIYSYRTAMKRLGNFDPSVCMVTRLTQSLIEEKLAEALRECIYSDRSRIKCLKLGVLFFHNLYQDNWSALLMATNQPTNRSSPNLLTSFNPCQPSRRVTVGQVTIMVRSGDVSLGGRVATVRCGSTALCGFLLLLI
jgi:hypothetical protein